MEKERYERVQSKVHNDVYHLMKIELTCKEKMPTERELNKLREKKRVRERKNKKIEKQKSDTFQSK